ncbi:MAG: sensor histidine kinase [Burkholderiales bacterium]|nr:sensor histidine kinase [Burkholderiales bacterium]
MYYPRSFLKFILLGFLLVSLPLVYALVELVLSLDRLARESRAEVLQASQAGRSSRLLFEQAATLERLARQEIILEDPALLEDYARMRQGFQQTTRQLSELPLDRAQLTSLAQLRQREDQLHALLVSRQRDPASVTRLAEGYASLVEDTQGMLNATAQLTQRAIERLQETAAQGREKWLWLALATAAIALALAVVFAVLIARPIRQLDQAIRRMGTADFTHAISVNGPQDLRYLGQRLEWLRARLAELEQQQSRFLRHVSHELKTPLTAVREGAELLRDNVGGRLAPEQQEIVRIVRENTLSLQKLIEDLLTYHHARASQEPATLSPVQLPDLVRRVLREQKLAAIARMITFETRLAPATVVGDLDKIRTVIDNLLSNAIKYSPRSGVIELDLVEQDGFAVLDVADHGPGIAPAERERVFDSFYSGKAPVDGKVKGSGLGLAIAREYALAQSGRIEVLDRTDGRPGVRFRLRLPLSLRAGPKPEAGAAAKAPAAEAPK